MTKEEKQTVAVFRFGVIHDFVSGIKLDPGEQEKLLQQKCERKWVIPYSDKTGISRSTILRWVQLYRDSGGRLESLETCERSDKGKARVLDEETSLSLMRLRKEMPGIPVPLFLETAKQRRITAPGVELSLSTLYRFLHHHHIWGQIFILDK